ncbi:hypothetical protein MF573_00310 [Klebsiella pneumoniae]|nr:hypothetical protein MF573_00310 [Klebsiella pneumoniae]
MEQWNPETRSHDRYVIDRVTASRKSQPDPERPGCAGRNVRWCVFPSWTASWSLFRPETLPVADGERLRVTGKIPGLTRLRR